MKEIQLYRRKESRTGPLVRDSTVRLKGPRQESKSDGQLDVSYRVEVHGLMEDVEREGGWRMESCPSESFSRTTSHPPFATAGW